MVPRLNNRAFHEIKQGQCFGHVDLGDEAEVLQMDVSARYLALNKDHYIRRFTAMTFSNCELLAFSIADVLKMKVEFPYAFIELFDGVKEQLSKELL